MKVTASEAEGSQVILDMEIESERVEKAMDRAYRRIVSRVNIPGFRRGKAPRVMIERVVGRDALMTEALEILLPEAYQEAVDQTGIDPVDVPKLDVVSAEPLAVRATVSVRPKVELGDYRSIRQSQEPVEITEQQVDDAMEGIRDSRAKWIPVERESRLGDVLTIDIQGRTETKEFLNSKGIQILLDPERPVLAPGVVEQITGMKTGDHKAFDVTLPEEFVDREVAGQEAALEVAVSDVMEKQLPEMNDELAREVGEYSSVDELRSAVRKELENQAEAQARRKLEESVVAAVVDLAILEIPVTWVDQQAAAMRESTQRRLKDQGLALEQYLQLTRQDEAAFQEELRSDARRQLKRTLVLSAVADAEGITVSDEEIDAALVQTYAEQERQISPQERERLRANLRSVLREQRAVSRLLEIAEGVEDRPETSEEEAEVTEKAESTEAEGEGAAAGESLAEERE